MKKLLIISGPTATGKTALAQLLAEKISSELISADSRQIYKGLDIGTGKDHTPNTKIHLIDLITPDQTFSAHEFASLARQKLQEIQSRNKLPIVVGGTGYYLNTLVNSHNFISPNIQNHFLFPVLNKLNINFLKSFYKFLAPGQFNSLNHAEQNNPHRLVKRILLKISFLKIDKFKINSLDADILHLHLDAPTEYLHSKIDRRIEKRLELGLLAEISKLIEKYSFSDPGLNTLSYQEFQPFFQETDTLANCIGTWIIHEHQYLKRQKTYFKKFFPKSYVIDITRPDYPKSVINLVQFWYNK